MAAYWLIAFTRLFDLLEVGSARLYKLAVNSLQGKGWL